MPIVAPDELKTIIADSHRPAVSIFLPTHRAGRAIQQDPIRLKNLVKQAEEQLIAEGLRAAEARDLLTPVSHLTADAGFWRHQDEGLAIFRSPDVLRVYRVPLSLQEFVAVGDRFHVKPLLPLLVDDARFYVLALSQKAVRLLECSRDHVQEVSVPELPQGMDEALPEGPEPQLQFHSLPLAGEAVTRFHGHGVGADDVDVVNVTRYFQRIEDRLRDVLVNQRAPLVLACVEYLAPLYRQVSSYPHITEEVITGNPDGVRNEELHQKAWAVVEPKVSRHREQAAAHYREGLAKGRAAHTLADVLAAAHQGRIATLFVPVGVHRWGRYDFDTLALEEHDEEQPGDDDLLERAALQTLLHRGVVYAVKPDEIPDRQLVAAVFRF